MNMQADLQWVMSNGSGLASRGLNMKRFSFGPGVIKTDRRADLAKEKLAVFGGRMV